MISTAAADSAVTEGGYRVEVYRPGELPATVRGGDFLLVHSPYLISRLIRLCTRSYFNHAAMVLDAEGGIAEALAEGIVRRNVAEWEDVLFAVVSPDLSEEDRRQVVEHAEWVVGEGWRYSWATILGMGLFWLTGGRLMLSSGAKAAICSAFVADCLHAGAIRFPEKIPDFLTPQDLAERFGVEDPEYD